MGIKKTNRVSTLTRDVSGNNKKPFSRKATFVVTTKNGKRVFTPVNKRAKAFAKLNKTATLGRAELLAIRKLGFTPANSATLATIKL